MSRHPARPTPSPEAPPFVIGGAQLDLVRAFGDDSHPDLVLVDDMWVFQADWERAGCRGWEAGVPVRSRTPGAWPGTPHPGAGRAALHLQLQGERGHGGQRPAGEDEGTDALAGQLTHAVPGAEAPVTEHLPWERVGTKSANMGAPPAVLTAPPRGPLLVHKSDQGDQPEPRAQRELGPSLVPRGSGQQGADTGVPSREASQPQPRHPDTDVHPGLAEHAEAPPVKSRRCWGCEGAAKPRCQEAGSQPRGPSMEAPRPQHGGPSQGPALPKRLALGSRLSAAPTAGRSRHTASPLLPAGSGARKWKRLK